MSTVSLDSVRPFFSIPLPYFTPNHENGGIMLFRNSGMHMQNYMMSHGQLSIVTTLRAGWSWVRILTGPRYFYVFFNVQTGCGSHWSSYGMVSWFFPMGDAAGAWIWRLHRAPMLKNERSYTSAPSVCLHVTTWMSNAGNRALEIRILNPKFDLPVTTDPEKKI